MDAALVAGLVLAGPEGGLDGSARIDAARTGPPESLAVGRSGESALWPEGLEIAVAARGIARELLRGHVPRVQRRQECNDQTHQAYTSHRHVCFPHRSNGDNHLADAARGGNSGLFPARSVEFGEGARQSAR